MTNRFKQIPSPEFVARLTQALVPSHRLKSYTKSAAELRWAERQSNLDAKARQHAIDAVLERTLKVRKEDATHLFDNNIRIHDDA